MNENELAKELESVPAYRNVPMFQRAATMLRQQQEKIATWEESFYNSVAENGKLRETIRQQQAEIEALNELNTMLKDAIEKRIEIDKQVYNIEFLKQPMQILENGQIVPLFKELTDEEIISEWVGCERNYYNFARAILRKASEK